MYTSPYLTQILVFRIMEAALRTDDSSATQTGGGASSDIGTAANAPKTHTAEVSCYFNAFQHDFAVSACLMC